MKYARLLDRSRIFLRDPNKKNPIRILKELIHLTYLKKELPAYYFIKYLYRKENTNYTDYLSSREVLDIVARERFNKFEFFSLFSNKLSFALFAQQQKLPVPAVYSYNFRNTFFYNEQIRNLTSTEDLVGFFSDLFSDTGEKNLFVKIIGGKGGGQGVYKLSSDDLQPTLKEYAPHFLNESFIHVQEVKQHPEINKINPFCVNTIRFETFIDKSGQIHILSALMRFGINKSYKDNASSGGFFVGIDLESGKLKYVGHQTMSFGGRVFYQHPDTGFRFADFEIPYFSEAKALVLEAVIRIPDRLIGWDIAISETDPVIIEANMRPGMFVSDIAYGGYLKNALFKEILGEIS